MPLARNLLFAALLATTAAHPAAAQRWATVWAGSDQGPYPVGNASAQPDLSPIFPHPEAGSHDQSFRLIIKPDVFGRVMRFRFSNAYGTRPVTFDTVFAGLQSSGATVAPGTSRPILFGGKPSVTVPPGQLVWSDAVNLPFVRDPADLAGRKLAISFHIPGDSGPMTWHAKALTTSYVTAPDAGATSALEDESAFPGSTTSWYFLDAADIVADPFLHVIVCVGDSITDGTASTLNGDDRWTDVLSRRLHAEGAHIVIVNTGIGGNQVVGPAQYSTDKPFAGGPSAQSRLDRDVLALDGVTDVILFEGINDLATGGAQPDAVYAGMKDIVARLRAKFKGVKVLGATVTSSRASTNPGYGTAEVDNRRHALNALIKQPGLFDGLIDFDSVTIDPQTGELKPEFVPPSTYGGPGDKLHPNRAGYLAMGDAVDLRMLIPPAPPRPKPRPKPADAPADGATPAPAAAQ